MRADQEIRMLMALYLAGETTLAQDKRLAVLLEQEPAAFHLVEREMQKVWETEIQMPDESPELNEDLAQIWERIKAEKREMGVHARIRSGKLLGYAAAILLLISLGVLLYMRAVHRPMPTGETRWVTRSTVAGEKVKLLLPDSSVVFLNAMSTIKYAENLKTVASRTIYLEGQAFFEVKSKVNQPFIVHTEGIQTTVLGTSFDVNAYANDEQIQIAVKTGKVKVSKKEGPQWRELYQLTPGMQLVYQKNNARSLTRNGLSDDFGSWTDNRFVFRNEPLRAILKTLQRNYKTKIVIASKDLDSCRFNATFNNKNIKQILDQLYIMSAGNISYTMTHNGTQITLKGKGCE